MSDALRSTGRELHAIRQMPYGTARTSRAEAIARRIEAEGPAEKLPEALLDLVEAYTFGGTPSSSFVAFARALRLWDESPELFDEVDRRNLFWEFKWVAADLGEFAQISLEQGEAFLSDMQRRFELAGHGISAVRMSRFRWAWETGSHDSDVIRQQWIGGLRDDLDDCPACTIGIQVDYFLTKGRYSEAVELGLSQSGSCNREPERTNYALALAALLDGRPELALATYKRAASGDDAPESSFASSRGQGFETLARGGMIERALRVLRNDHAELLEDSGSPLLRVRLLTSLTAGLSAHLNSGGDPHLATGIIQRDRTTTHRGTALELRDWAYSEARTLATELDKRNVSPHLTAKLEEALTATLAADPLPDYAELTPHAPSAPEESAAVPNAAQSPAALATARADMAQAAEGPPSHSSEDAESALGAAERFASRKEYERAAAEYYRAGELLLDSGWIDRAGIAFAESAQCHTLVGLDEAAHTTFALAVSLLRQGELGDTEQDVLVSVLSAWAPIAARMGNATELLTVGVTLLETLASQEDGASHPVQLTEELAERRRQERLLRRASLRDTIARSIAAAHASEFPAGVDRIRAITEARAAAEEFAEIHRIADAAHSFWLSARVQLDLGDTEGALWSLESAFEGFTLAREKQDRATVAGELIELLRESGQPDQAEIIVSRL